MAENTSVSLPEYRQYSEAEMHERACAFYEEMRRRRSVRSFSSKPVDRRIIENCLRTAGTAPSGANQQPWHFVVVSDPAIKRKIRAAAEKIENEVFKLDTRETCKRKALYDSRGWTSCRKCPCAGYTEKDAAGHCRVFRVKRRPLELPVSFRNRLLLTTLILGMKWLI